MDRNYYRSRITTHYDWKRTQVIVDDSQSSNPHLLLPWLKRRLQTFAPVNNADYNPILLPAA